MLRNEPTQKKSIDKFMRNAKKHPEIYPNEKVPDEQTEIFLDHDIMDKNYYYQKLAQRLGYSRVYQFGNVNTSLTDYDQENSQLQKKKGKWNPGDSLLNGEMINFSKLDDNVEGNNKRR
jgi:CRISPR/Cas system-associated endonuclease/helicase Cas3